MFKQYPKTKPQLPAAYKKVFINRGKEVTAGL